jgi:hypothetical protein
VLAHELGGGVDLLVDLHADHAASRDVAHLRGVGGAALGDRAHDDVAVGQDPERVVAVEDEDGSDVAVAHLLRGLGQRRVRTDGAQIAGHHLSYGAGHGCSSLWLPSRRYPVRPESTGAALGTAKERGET